MALIKEPAKVLAPSSDADEGLPRQGSSHSTRPSLLADSINDNSSSSSVDVAGDAPSSLKDPAKPGTKGVPSTGHAPIIYKELAPLVAMPPPSDAAIHNRLAKHSYSRLGRNLLFEARPAVIHFGGYVLGKPHSQRVRVVNIARTSQRLHILGPTTDCFKIRCNKKGLIAPGSSEVITVDFHPREHRYHYDCVRLHTDSENLLIPLHAYPVMNDVVFPERLDFGVHALGGTRSRTVKMVCKVPIQFEFQIEVTKSHPHFKIGPLRGIVPANGAAEVHIEHTPSTASSAEMHLLVSVSQFNFTPIVCVVTGAARPGVVREAALAAAASNLEADNTLRDSLGPILGSYAQAQARKLRGARDRDRNQLRQNRRRGRRGREEEGADDGGGGGGGDQASGGREEAVGRNSGKLRPEGGGARAWTEAGGSVNEELEHLVTGGSVGWGETPFEDNESFGREEGRIFGGGEEAGDLMDTWATRPASAEQRPYGTGKGSGAVFDAGGEWLAAEKRGNSRRPAEPWAPPTEGSVFGSAVGGPAKTTVIEGLVIPAKLDSVQATNFVLTQQPGKLKPKDLKEAIRRTRAERQRQLEEQEALRLLTATVSSSAHDGGAPGDPGFGQQTAATCLTEGYGGVEGDGGQQQQQQQEKKLEQEAQLSGRMICAYEATAVGGGGGGGGGATRQLKEMSFLQDLAETEAQERDRSFKASVEHVGEPLLTSREIARALEERRRSQRRLRRSRREEERGSLETCLKGPGEVGARCAKASLLLTGDGTQGVGFRHEPDWDVYKNDDWGRRREVLRRLVNAVGAWIVRRRAGRRLTAIQARIGGLQDRAEVAAMVERDNQEAKLTAGPPAGTSQASWRAVAGDASTGGDDGDGGWEFPDLLVTSEALAADMLAEAMGAGAAASAGSSGWRGGDSAVGSSARGWEAPAAPVPPPPPPEFRLSAGDVDSHRFPIYDEGAALSRREEVVDAIGPPSDFVDIDLLPLREPEERRSMGYATVRPPGLGTYPSIETSRPLRWSAFEECGVRQPRDGEEEPGRSAEAEEVLTAGWRQALSSTERRQSKASLGRRRSSVGLRMTSATTEDAEEAWLPAAEAELTALAAEAERIERMPDSLLLRPPPPGGVDLITPDPRYKAFLSELPADEASPEWCLRPREIPREVPATKGLLLGYSPGTTTLRAYAEAPRLSGRWRPKRERRSSGLACMRGQASRGVWRPTRGAAAAATTAARRLEGLPRGAGGGVPSWDAGGGDESGESAVKGARGKNSGGGGGGIFVLAADHAAAAAAAGDALSDSESEDEEDESPVPTPATARAIFDDAAATDRAGEEGRRGSLSGSSTKATANQLGDDLGSGGGGGGGAVQSRGEEPGEGREGEDKFARDEALAELEGTRRKRRVKDAERLADRMSAIGAEIRNIKHAFVLQTPFHRIRSRRPEAQP